MSDKKFCYECRKEVEYEVTLLQLVSKVTPQPFVYAYNMAKCVYCGNEVFVDELHAVNLSNFNKARDSTLSNKT